MGEMRNTYRILAGKPEGKKSLEDRGTAGNTILER
jgi:hypothetical protein